MFRRTAGRRGIPCAGRVSREYRERVRREDRGRRRAQYAEPVFAVVDTDAARGGLYRSDDGGVCGSMSDGIRLWGRCWYFCHVSVDTKDADVVYVSNLALYRSSDGGRSFGAVNVRASAARFKAIKGSPDGDDYHQLWIDPVEPSRMILAADQGASISVDGAATWSTRFNQPTGSSIPLRPIVRFRTTCTRRSRTAVRCGWLRAARTSVSRNAIGSRSSVGSENSAMVPDPRDPDRVYGDQYPPG